ncbi:MAG TPA: TraR/DksA C4-type zinc finger protein [Bacteroidales bacterium]|jgi:RNA polymerase-binding transcription factor DksA|nr:TraR/DksA C4-type zinc finger protein [Bacteroidales bacterium]MDI6832876.1 TraR/DksA C4-type zinc finger protein [Bacteroidales bacterium]HNQ21355.1 TraR/DksA C4-type zinc finger protein [Bacteroidales bacterium]HNT70443.1 TraR/DksA C4-type zinc finger protein [Bacteroidales bacterium]HNY75432.1 TraR/DksA C4-type zinc finger protein [Bacteroidales bacterium]
MAVDNKEEKTRYSDEELEEFKQIILKKLDKAKTDLEILRESMHSDGEVDTNLTYRLQDDGKENLIKEENARLIARLERFVRDLELALVRIENKTYGICRVTGKLIEKDRLRAVPHATLSIEAKLKMQKGEIPVIEEENANDEDLEE